MLSEFDYKLLGWLSVNRVTITTLLQNYGDGDITRRRYDRLMKASLIRLSDSFIILTPLGKTELEDYNQRESAEKTSEERASAAILCAIASAIAAVASAICAIATLFK